MITVVVIANKQKKYNQNHDDIMEIKEYRNKTTWLVFEA